MHWAHIHSVNDRLGCTSVPFSVSNSDSNQGTLTTGDLDVFFFFMARKMPDAHKINADKD